MLLARPVSKFSIPLLVVLVRLMFNAIFSLSSPLLLMLNFRYLIGAPKLFFAQTNGGETGPAVAATCVGGIGGSNSGISVCRSGADVIDAINKTLSEKSITNDYFLIDFYYDSQCTKSRNRNC